MISAIRTVRHCLHVFRTPIVFAAFRPCSNEAYSDAGPQSRMKSRDEFLFEEGIVADLRSGRNREYMSGKFRAVKKRSDAYTPCDLKTSIAYTKSSAFQETYLGKPVWYFYRRNYPGHFPPKTTRKTCVMGGKLIISSPCPICRDEQLVLHYSHTDLLKHFVDPLTGQILDVVTTGVCQRQHKKIVFEIAKAQELGLIEVNLPFRVYNYEHYYPDVDPSVNQVYEDTQIPYAQAVEIKEQTIVINRPSVPDPYDMLESEKVKQKRIRMNLK